MEWTILTHGDCDGICSASLAFSINRSSKVIFTTPASLLSDLKSIRSGEGQIVITDIALTPKHAGEIILELERLSLNNRIIYLDHHPLPSGLGVSALPVETIFSVGACASELVYTYFEEELEPEMSRVAVYGAIGDYCDNTPCIKDILENWDKRELYLEAGILIAAIERAGKRDYALKKHLVEYLSENRLPSLDENLVNMAIQQSKMDEAMRHVVKSMVKVLGKVAYVVGISWSLGKAATYARVYGNAIVGVAAEEEGDNVDMSIRSIGLENLNEVVARVAESLNGIGGGHANAAGAKVPKETFQEFIKRLNEKISQ
ncbi:MAG: DHHA1 domain-containing protein [Thermoproteota archaeon]